MFNQPQQTPMDPESMKRSGLFTVRIINGSFIAGLVMFTILTVVLSARREAEVDEAAGQQASADGVFWMVIGVLGVIALAGAAILPGIFTKQARNAVSKAGGDAEANPGLWAGPWFTLQILRMAPIQATGLLAVTVVLVSGDFIFLIPAAACIGALVAVAPTRAKLDAFEALAKNTHQHPTMI